MDILVFQILTIVLLLIFSIIDLKKWRELAFIAILISFTFSLPQLSQLYKILITLVSIIFTILFYILRLTFPFLEIVKKSIETDRKKLATIIVVLFIVALLNILQFSHSIILDQSYEVFTTGIEKLSSKKILTYITLALTVVTIGIVKMEEKGE